MQREMEVIRKVLLAIDAKDNLKTVPIAVDGVDDQVLGRHIEMLVQDGFVEGIVRRSSRDSGFGAVLVRDLTWQGHEFLAVMKQDGVWNKLKKELGPAKLATMPLTVVKDLGIVAVKAWAMKKLGLG